VDPVAALEIGTSKVIAMVGEMREDRTVMVTGMGECQSVGVRKGEIIDLENAMACVRSALESAEKTSNVFLGQVYLCVSGGHIRGRINSGTFPIIGSEGVVSEEDIDEVVDIARAVSLPDDRQVIHTIHRYFQIDDQEKIVSPEGMVGTTLGLDMLVLHGVRSLLTNSSRVVEQLQLEVNDIAFGGLCSALSVLTAEQKKSGALVVDLGGGTTDYMAYADGVATCGGSLGVGGDHVTNDIAQAFNISLPRAERLKKDMGRAIVAAVTEPARVSLPDEVGFQGRTVNVRSMHIVINARMKEIFEMVKKQLGDDNILRMVGAGVILTGGGTHLKGVTELAEKVFGVPCFVGSPRGITGIATVTDGPEYAACCGLLQYGFRVQGESTSGGGSLLGSFVKTLLGTR
jgi:cell division protein FtsA